MTIRSVFFLIILLEGLNVHAQLEIHKLTDSVYVYTTYRELESGPFPSNSMYVLTSDGIVMIDTPWDTTQLAPLLDSMKVKHNAAPIFSFSTHFHDDRTAGLKKLDSMGVKTHSTLKTKNLCLKHNNEIAQHTFLGDTLLNIGGKQIQFYYPGKGHTEDNIVVYVNGDDVLYGGCLVKSYEATNLGYTGDSGTLDEWIESLKIIKKKFKSADFIIPGHQSWTSKQSINHSIKLLKKEQKIIEKMSNNDCTPKALRRN